MQQKSNCGKLAHDSFIFKEITWEIPEVLSLPRQVDYEVRSHEFTFADATWVLEMYPYGQGYDDSTSYITLIIYRLHSLEEEHEVYFKFFLKTSKGKEFEPWRYCANFTSTDDSWGVARFMKHSKLVSMQNSLAPGGTLTVVCQMRTKSTATVEVTPQEKIVRPVTAGETSGETSKVCREKRIEAYTQTEGDLDCETLEEALKNSKSSIEVHTQTETEFDIRIGREQSEADTPDQKFVQDYKELLLSGDGCDVTLLVQGQKFEAHRTILRARSPVFASMLKHNMKEKNTGLIDIEDCDPETFPDFLRFLYCGSIDSITSQNACSLYRAADKYDVQDLKSESLTFIKSHLDVDNFCNVVMLALKHTEAGLLQQATDFFARNMLKIIVTVKWQVFVTENPIEGNELTIKALSANKSSCP